VEDLCPHWVDTLAVGIIRSSPTPDLVERCDKRVATQDDTSTLIYSDTFTSHAIVVIGVSRHNLELLSYSTTQDNAAPSRST
jgi:hypothetical protein